MTEAVSKPAGVSADWSLIQADYEAGIKSVRTIATEHGVSHTLVNRRAKKEGWTRNLLPKIQAKADSLVSTAAVSTGVASGTRPTERQVIDANANQQYRVRIAHRGRIQEATEVYELMLAELKATGLTREHIELLLANQTDLTARQRDDHRQILVRLMGTGSRIGNFNTLIHALERLVKLERQAYGIESGEAEDNPASPAGAAVAGGGRGLSDAERAIRLARLFALQGAGAGAAGAAAA